MGLDQYAYKRKKGAKKDDTTEIMQWRKHNRLHGWMEQLWREKEVEKGNYEDLRSVDFNCVRLRLKMKDLNRLAKDIANQNFPETQGFFFGTDSYDQYTEYYMESDIKFLWAAYRAIGNGEKVYYDCWW